MSGNMMASRKAVKPTQLRDFLEQCCYEPHLSPRLTNRVDRPAFAQILANRIVVYIGCILTFT